MESHELVDQRKDGLPPPCYDVMWPVERHRWRDTVLALLSTAFGSWLTSIRIEKHKVKLRGRLQRPSGQPGDGWAKVASSQVHSALLPLTEGSFRAKEAAELARSSRSAAPSNDPLSACQREEWGRACAHPMDTSRSPSASCAVSSSSPQFSSPRGRPPASRRNGGRLASAQLTQPGCEGAARSAAAAVRLVDDLEHCKCSQSQLALLPRRPLPRQPAIT
jgi:hypothetical protein